MDIKQAADILASIVDTPIKDAWFLVDEGVLMLGFEHGKTVYIRGNGLEIDMEAPN
jgi:hypothetical protein